MGTDTDAFAIAIAVLETAATAEPRAVVASGVMPTAV
jgi:hypothetical protein